MGQWVSAAHRLLQAGARMVVLLLPCALVALYPAVADSPCCLQPSAMAGCVEGSVNGYEGDGPWPDVQDAPGAIVRSCDRALLTTQSTVNIQYANPF